MADKQPETNGSLPVGDVFDNLEGLRQSQAFNKLKTIKLFKTCPIRKPKKHEWFRVHPEHRL